MEPNPLSPPEPSEEPLPVVLGELVVENGRQRGARQALTSELTLIGRDAVCEILLNIEGVNPLHCAIVYGPDGFVLRDLGTASGTILNDEVVQTSPLRHGDLIGVGPFQFRLELPSSDEPPEPPLSAGALRAERDALRIQAAAVAAQQASLAEEESQLHKRRKTLERQKEQLAAHLDERRQQLLDLRERARHDRAALKAECEVARHQQEEVRAALENERTEVRQELDQIGKERRRLIELRKRLKKRWRKHWQVHEKALERRGQVLAAERDGLEREAANLRRERVQLTQAQLRFNGEVELGRRKLQEEWQQLGLAQQQWEACLNQEHAERAVRLREMDRRAAALTATEQALLRQKLLAEQCQLKLRKEADGLEARIRNQRQKLLEQGQQLAQTTPIPRPDETSLPASAVRWREPDVPGVLARLAGELADQRLHLLEQWQRFLVLHEAWEPERAAVLAEIDRVGQTLAQRELRLVAKEQTLASAEEDLLRRQEALFEVRCSLEAWQARLTARETFLDNERVMLLADVRAREDQADAQMRRLETLHQRRVQRRSREFEALRSARQRHEQMRRDYLLLWQECQNRRTELIRAQRDQAARMIALEQLRQELLGRADDTPGMDKRLERLQRRNLARIQAEERDLIRERKELVAETQRLDERARRLDEDDEALAARREAWTRQVAEAEERQTACTALEQHRAQELRHWKLVHEQDERQLSVLREEVERIARLLLDEAEPAPPANRAA